ncbi:MAG: hypothetical protein MMC23_001727 [Stictis urceolatum]|nr:hypothetical protein [Stictis urceolata]
MASKSSHPINHAASIPAFRSSTLSVGEAPYTPATPTSIVIRVRPVAVNPIDWLIQSRGNLMFSHLKYPAIIGHDIAGEVVEVGSSVSNFKIGDCVAGFSLGTDKEVNDNAEGGFQEYVVLQPRCTFLIPDGISFERACEIPLGLLTSIGGLFESHQLGLQLPASPAQPSTKQAVVTWGGSTSVGCNAIQLAIAAGYDVFANSTPRNFELMRRLGAKQFFDYNSSSVASEMLSAIGSTPLAGALAIGVGGAEQCMTILSLAPVVVKKHVALATVPASGAEPRWFDTFRTIAGVLSWGRYVFEEFMGKAFSEGTFVPAPDPQIVGDGKGLGAIEEAFALLRKGVSAKKIVVRL